MPPDVTAARLQQPVIRDRLAAWLRDEFGLTLHRCSPERAIGRVRGSWKTGWAVEGSLPGFTHSWYRFRSLRAVAQRFRFPG
jgi:hypothetical protein